MKNILITGAAGTVGKKVIKYLLMEGKYNITAVDLKTSYNKHVLKKYRKRVEIIYADITNDANFEDAVKKSDFVIHLAGIMPPLADLNENLTYKGDYKGTENIVRILDFFNPNCHLLYASSTTVYGKQDSDTVSINTKINEESLGAFAKNKLNSENIIKEKLKNYSIYRLPVILCNPIESNFMFSYKANKRFEVVSDEDVGYMFSRAIDKISELNKKTFNVGGGEACITTGSKLNNDMLKYYGLTSKYLKTKLFIDKNFYSYIYKDSNKLDDILTYRNDSIDSYFLRTKRKEKNYYIRKLFGKIFYRNKNKA